MKISVSVVFCLGLLVMGCGKDGSRAPEDPMDIPIHQDQDIPTQGDGPLSPGGDPVGGKNEEVKKFVDLVKSHRQQKGCTKGMGYLTDAEKVAQGHSHDMKERKYFDHINPEGESPGDRLKKGGVTNLWGWGENIALNRGGANEVLRAWLNSPGHRQNLENCDWTHHGVGEENGLWTHVFLKLKGKS